MSIYKIYFSHNRTNVSYVFKWSNLFIIFSVFIVSSCASMRAIPDNFTKIDEFILNDITVYQVFKKNN